MVNYDYQMVNYGYYGGWGLLVSIFCWALIIVVIVVVVKWFTCRRGKCWHNQDKSPFEILKERYAKGEIDKNDYEEIRNDLEKLKNPPPFGGGFFNAVALFRLYYFLF